MSEGEAGEQAPGAVFLSGCEPVRVWFAWHPQCEGGAELAQTLAGALGELGGADRAGTGVPTYFATSTDAHVVPLDIPPGGEGDEVIVVPLLDAHFVADPRWRRWLGRLTSGTFSLLPVALDNSAFRLDAVRALAYLSYDGEADGLERVMLVEIARILLHGKRPRIFLSYATADGGKVAHALRDAVARYPRMDFFLDVDSLAAGDDFPDALRRAVDAEVAAMIAIHTDHYGTRPWCRRELASFRQPRRQPSGVWHLRTLLVVDHISDGIARVLGELAGAPLVRYVEGQEVQILARLVRGLVLSEYHRRRAERVSESSGGRGDGVAIDWVPDAHTIASLNRSLGEAPATIWFPGGGLERMEFDAVREAMKPQAIETLDSVLERRTTARARPRTVVGLSMGKPSEDDLARRGLGPHHVSAALDRLARLLIGHGVDVSFGGLIDHGFTRALSETLKRYVRSADALMETRGARGDLPQRSMLVNFARQSNDLTPQRIADGLGLVRFIDVATGRQLDELDRERGRQALPTGLSDSTTEWAQICAMRWRMNGSCTAVDTRPVQAPLARIVAGGKTSDYMLALPGIVEESLYASRRGIPLFVVGAIGGAARVLGDFLFNGGDIRGRLGQSATQHMTESWWDAVMTLRTTPGPDNGLTAAENRRLFEARDLDTVIHLLSKGLTALLERSGRRADQS